MKVLFIAYYFDPFPGVGAKRVSYWAKHIGTESAGQISATVITATPPKDYTVKPMSPKVVYVEDRGESLWKYLFKKDKGITWANDLKRYFRANQDNFDFDLVLITGGPFLHFGLGAFLKKKYKCRIVLDFRDPFAVNPLFQNQHFIKVTVKKYLERKFISDSDVIITVNKYCAKLLAVQESSKIAIIDNGFDEKIVNRIESKSVENGSSKLNIVYAGKLSQGRSLKAFLAFIENNSSIIFHYIGDDYKSIQGRRNTKIYGVKPYLETLQIINACDIGLVLTGGNSFESTTKIFDYIGLNKQILVISKRKITKGSIKDVLEEYPNHLLCQENNSDFNKILIEVNRRNTNRKIDIQKFSRNQGLKKLIDLLIELK